MDLTQSVYRDIQRQLGSEEAERMMQDLRNDSGLSKYQQDLRIDELRNIFPSISKEVITEHLKQCNWDVEEAIPGLTEYLPTQPRRSTAEILHDQFPEFSTAEIQQALNSNNDNQESTAIALHGIAHRRRQESERRARQQQQRAALEQIAVQLQVFSQVTPAQLDQLQAECDGDVNQMTARLMQLARQNETDARQAAAAEEDRRRAKIAVLKNQFGRYITEDEIAQSLAKHNYDTARCFQPLSALYNHRFTQTMADMFNLSFDVVEDICDFHNYDETEVFEHLRVQRRQPKSPDVVSQIAAAQADLAAAVTPTPTPVAKISTPTPVATTSTPTAAPATTSAATATENSTQTWPAPAGLLRSNRPFDPRREAARTAVGVAQHLSAPYYYGYWPNRRTQEEVAALVQDAETHPINILETHIERVVRDIVVDGGDLLVALQPPVVEDEFDVVDEVDANEPNYVNAFLRTKAHFDSENIEVQFTALLPTDEKDQIVLEDAESHTIIATKAIGKATTLVFANPPKFGSYIFRYVSVNNTLRGFSDKFTYCPIYEIECSYDEGANEITVTWSRVNQDGNAYPNAWIGLYGEEGLADNNYLTWQWCSKGQLELGTNVLHNGSLKFKPPRKSFWQVRLFPNRNQYERVATGTITIAGSDLLTHTIKDQDLTVDYQLCEVNSTSNKPWVGLYIEQDQQTDAATTEVTPNLRNFLRYKSIPSGTLNGKLEFSKIPAGNYRLRLFSNSSYTSVVFTSEVIVVA